MPKHKPEHSKGSSLSRHKSDIWKYFRLTADRKKTVCDMCHATLAYCGSTSSMRNHFRFRHKTIYTNSSLSGNDTNKNTFSPTKTLKSTESGQEADTDHIHRTVAVMCAVDLLPVSVISGKGFKNFAHTLNPNCQMPTTSRVLRYLEVIYEEVKQTLLEKIRGQSVAITTDMWTGTSEDQFITITCHYIGMDWNLESSVVATRKVDGALTSSCIANCLVTVINEYNIDSVVALVSRSTEIMKTSAQAANITHVQSFSHTLQMIINEALELPDISLAIDESKKLRSYFSQSQTASDALKLQQKNLGISTSSKIPQDDSGRWTCTLHLMQKLLSLRVAIYAVIFDDQFVKPTERANLKMNDATWNILETVVPVLEPLADTVDLLTKKGSPTGSCVYQLLHTIMGIFPIKAAESKLSRQLKHSIREGIKTYFDMDDHGIPLDCTLKGSWVTATVLDPRYKSLKFLSHEKRQVVYDYIMILMELSADKSTNTLKTELCDEAEKKQSPSPGPVMKRLLDCLRGDVLEQCTTDSLSSTKQELEEFLSEPVRTADPLVWWNINSNRFPTLGKLARRYLCIPAAEISSVVGPSRHMLRAALDSHVDEIIFLHKNYEISAKPTTCVSLNENLLCDERIPNADSLSDERSHVVTCTFGSADLIPVKSEIMEENVVYLDVPEDVLFS